jgi:hypothetical protein
MIYFNGNPIDVGLRQVHKCRQVKLVITIPTLFLLIIESPTAIPYKQKGKTCTDLLPSNLLMHMYASFEEKKYFPLLTILRLKSILNLIFGCIVSQWFLFHILAFKKKKKKKKK